jgi:hypothetical protein
MDLKWGRECCDSMPLIASIEALSPARLNAGQIKKNASLA